MFGVGHRRTMPTLISMIRGINVGGNRPLKMDRLRGLHEDLGYRNVRTYLQSGNAVFEAGSADAGSHSVALAAAILRHCGYDVAVAVRTAKAMSAVLAGNPLLRLRAVDRKFLHATFLVRPAAPASLEGIELPLAPGERAQLVGETLYLYCPNGYGNSKLHNAFFERKLRVAATTRNWQTVTALEAMARGEPR
jgi:uncharacterized protein (DUF1697 family)